ncbi:MAG: flotillin [Devosia sp.]|nr:flotillin [Devosia sp.]
MIVIPAIGAVELGSLLIGFSPSSSIESALPEIDLPDVDAPDADGLELSGAQMGPFSLVLSWLSVGRVPVLVLLVIALTSFGIAGYALQWAVTSVLGGPLSGLLASIPALIAAAYATRHLGRWLGRVFPRDHSEAASQKEMIGSYATIIRGEAKRGQPAEEELHEQRVNFVQKVQAAVSEDILKNGLELESVSLTGLDQTNREFFNADNVFDAEGLTKMTQAIEDRRKTRNDIEQNTQVAIARKNLEAQTEQYQISRDTEYARLNNEREIAIRIDQQNAEIESLRAQRATEAEAARTLSRQQMKEAAIKADQAISISEQTSATAVAAKSEEQSKAEAKADAARALAAKAAEEVETARMTEVAERTKRIQLIEAAQEAEKASINIVVSSDAEKQAAKNRAEAARTLAQGEAEAAKLRAAATEVTYAVEAAGKQKLNEAANQLSPEQIAMNIRMALIEALPRIIAESVKPMENIEGIKILHVDGLSGGGSNGGMNGHSGGGIADQAVDAALRYRSQAPLIDALLAELGLKGGTLNGLVSSAVGPALEIDSTAEASPLK